LEKKISKLLAQGILERFRDEDKERNRKRRSTENHVRKEESLKEASQENPAAQR
jgi:hypothetical protein